MSMTSLQAIRERLERLKALTHMHDCAITDFAKRKRAADIASLPLVSDLETLLNMVERYQGIIVRNTKQRLQGKDVRELFVTQADIAESLSILYQSSDVKPKEEGEA